MIGPPAVLSRARCRFCGGALTVHQSVGEPVCAGPPCRRRFARELVVRREERLLAERRALGEEHRRRFAGHFRPEDLATIAVAVVPSLRRATVRSSGRRRQRFLAHLSGMLETLDGPNTGRGAPASPPAGASGEPSPDAGLLGAACATCKGFCCTGGGDHAYLREPDLEGFRARHPALTAAETLATYGARIPRRTYADSCLFHGPAGCGLPRDMRSAVCNNHYCPGLHQFHRDLGGVMPSRVLVVAPDDREVVAAARVDSDGRRRRLPAREPRAGRRAVPAG